MFNDWLHVYTGRLAVYDILYMLAKWNAQQGNNIYRMWIYGHIPNCWHQVPEIIQTGIQEYISWIINAQIIELVVW